MKNKKIQVQFFKSTKKESFFFQTIDKESLELYRKIMSDRFNYLEENNNFQ